MYVASAKALMAPYFSFLETIAEAWLDMGATSFSIWAEQTMLYAWPSGDVPPASCATAILLRGTSYAELRVSGLERGWGQKRLHADALSIANLMRLEDDLDSVAGEMIDMQDQLVALFDLSRSTRQIVDVPTLLNGLAEAVVGIAKVETAFVVLSNDAEARYAQAGERTYDEAVFQTWAQYVISNGKDLLIDSEQQACSIDQSIHNMFVTPITLNGATAGAIGMFNKVGGFNSPDIKLAHAIAEQAGAQIENVMMHEEMLERTRWQTEMELARQVQLRLLPRDLPHTAGIEIAARSRPALQVGGDFFDFVEAPQRPLTFAIGDITGKGMPAAMIMAMTRTVLRSKVNFMPAPGPEAIMQRANEDLYDDFTETSMFATTFIGQYDPRERRVTYVNAGHSPVIYGPRAGCPTLLEADGLPMGVMTDTMVEEHVVALEPEAVLMVATDGFSEARDADGEMFGYERLLEFVAQWRGKPAAEIAEALFETITAWSGQRFQDDDQTLVILKGVATEEN